ncbi:MAG TPA: hypothetical protein VJU86_23090 [Pyrinomonadaceae bacterium]|nr:hypothetical protein [Pyrinomonadaceae bacterium]
MPRKKKATIDPYVRLRTILDSLEDGAIRLYLKHQDGPRRGKKKFDEIESQLMPVVEWLWGNEEILCPPGYNNCDGVCVPYTCPRGYDDYPLTKK